MSMTLLPRGSDHLVAPNSPVEINLSFSSSGDRLLVLDNKVVAIENTINNRVLSKFTISRQAAWGVSARVQ
jgi:hypothetical protein